MESLYNDPKILIIIFEIDRDANGFRHVKIV